MAFADATHCDLHAAATGVSSAAATCTCLTCAAVTSFFVAVHDTCTTDA